MALNPEFPTLGGLLFVAITEILFLFSDFAHTLLP